MRVISDDISKILLSRTVYYHRFAHLILDINAALAVQGVGDVDGERPGVAVLAVGAGVCHVNGVLLGVVDSRSEEGLAEALQSSVQSILAIILVKRILHCSSVKNIESRRPCKQATFSS